MGKDSARPMSATVLGLLHEKEKSLYRAVFAEVRRFPKIVNNKNPLVHEKELNRHYDILLKQLDDVRATEQLALIMGVEYAILERDEKTLSQLAKRYGVDQNLKSDMTTNQKSREAVGGALEALEYQTRDPEHFHEIMNIGTARKNFDSRHLPIDVVRDAARSQANALRNDMKGLFQTDQERKRRDFLDRRYQNMVTGESIYTSIQMAAQRNRDNNHALF